MTKPQEKQPHRPPVRPRHPWRDTVEGLLGALVLVLIIRHFVFEVFRIPTGSMAPTLLGQHRDLKCPNCGLDFPVDGNLGNGAAEAFCPNCRYEFPRDEVRNTFCTCFPSWPPFLFSRGDNRVIVDKFMWDYPDDALARLFYRSGLPREFSPPKRWDVVVFRCPVGTARVGGVVLQSVRIDDGGSSPEAGAPAMQVLSQQDFIKRLVGLPGDTIRIRHGDIFVNGKIEPRSPEAQDAQWQFVYDSFYAPKQQVESAGPAWVATEGDAKLDGAALRLTPGAKGTAEAQYGRSINDVSTYSGFEPSLRYYPVGEIKWDVEATLDHAGILRLAIDEDKMRYVAAVRFGNAAAKTSLRASGREAPVESDFFAEPGKKYRITFINASGRLELTVDGATILRCDHPLPENDQSVSSGAAISVESAKADVARIRLYRTIYYRPPEYAGTYAIKSSDPDAHVMNPFSLTGADGYRIPQGQYLMLGDNQPSSWDSRYWGTVPQRNLIGRGVVLWWPVGMLRPIY